jgi:hypothetical protein
MRMSYSILIPSVFVLPLLAAGCNRSNAAALAQAKAEAEAAKTEAQTAKTELAKSQDRAATAEAELAKIRAASSESANAQEADRRAAAWVLRVGGIVRVFADGVQSEYSKDGKLPEGPFGVTYVNIAEPGIQGKLTNDGIKYLDGIKHLKELHMSGANVDDFSFLGGLESLEVFHGILKDADLFHFKAPGRMRDLLVGNYWGNPDFTDAGLAQIKLFENLERLDLSGCKITNGGLQTLGDFSKLRFLSLYGTPISDDGLRHLRGLSELRELNMERAPVSGPGLAHLKELPKFTSINLGATKMTDSGLVHLGALENLEFVSLAYLKEAITDAGLIHLKGMSNLKHLDLRDTKVTDAGVAELMKSLPNCQIVAK